MRQFTACQWRRNEFESGGRKFFFYSAPSLFKGAPPPKWRGTVHVWEDTFIVLSLKLVYR